MTLSLVQKDYAESLCVALNGDMEPAAWCTFHGQETIEGEAFCEKGAALAVEKRPSPVRVEGVTSKMVRACARAEYEVTQAAEFCPWRRLPEAAKARRLEAATRGLNAVEALR